MKTETQEKFDIIVKEGFQNILKPLGFKKKANNFYLELKELGHIINIQKSKWSTKDEISFTINTGIFIPTYWSVVYNYKNEEVPKYPTESECLIRKRIGEIRNQHDTWYDIKEHTNEKDLIEEMKLNVQDFILPYFESINSQHKLLYKLESENLILSPLGKMIFYAEINQHEKAKIEYRKLLKEKTNPHFLDNVREYGRRYQLD